MARHRTKTKDICVTLLINGRFSSVEFCDWIAHRAKLLSLSGWVKQRTDGMLEIQISGNKVLIDAMETACSLGPLDAQVESISAQQQKLENTAEGFSIL